MCKIYGAMDLLKIGCSIGVSDRSQNCFTMSVKKKQVSQLFLPILDYGDTVYQIDSILKLRRHIESFM